MPYRIRVGNQRNSQTSDLGCTFPGLGGLIGTGSPHALGLVNHTRRSGSACGYIARTRLSFSGTDDLYDVLGPNRFGLYREGWKTLHSQHDGHEV